MTVIRPERAGDHAAVRIVNERAFGRSAEADLVDALRRSSEPFVSLVAERGGAIVGHIFFSPITLAGPVKIESARPPAVMGLAPMAVLPELQRQGVGSALVREGLRACERLGCDAVVVLGHAEYYPRFGFRTAAAFGLRTEYDVPEEVFMAVELKRGALDGPGGIVSYPEAFNDVE